MKTDSTNQLPACGLRLTALFSVAIVMLLAVFSASPDLHAWLHAHEVTHQAPFGGHDHQTPGQDDDDGCVITMFANGVIAAIVAIAVLVGAWRIGNFVAFGEAEMLWPVPRYWLPPLCGPPLS